MTHHANPSEAAEAWKRDGVCAIGWTNKWEGDIRKVKQSILSKNRAFAVARTQFLDIRKEDLVLAYARNNMIAYVGEVKGGYRYSRDNEVGRKDGFNYPNQLQVDWWPEPHHFDRKELPSWLASQLGKIGKTITKIETYDYGCERTIAIIRTCPTPGSALAQIEDLVKAGIRKYLPNVIGDLEPGLRLTGAEHSISAADRPDFIAIDRNERTVIIECKGTAKERDCEQVERYGKTFKSKNPRLMLVAFKFQEGCEKAAKKRGLELVECELRFKKVGRS